MARPKKEGMDYFPHDTDAVNDEKIEALRMLYGNDGYAFYFILLERIYRTKDFELDISDAETIQILSRKVGINSEEFNQILQSALKRGCFDREIYEKRGVLTSEGIKKRASVVLDKRSKMQEKYRRDKVEEVSDAETEQKPSRNATKERKDKSKDKVLINIVEVVDYLNLKSGKNYKPNTKKTNDFIKARAKENFTIDDFKKVINIKVAEWLGTPQEKYLRPETLFGTKFEGYLNQKTTQPTTNFGTHKKDNSIKYNELTMEELLND